MCFLRHCSHAPPFPWLLQRHSPVCSCVHSGLTDRHNRHGSIKVKFQLTFNTVWEEKNNITQNSEHSRWLDLFQQLLFKSSFDVFLFISTLKCCKSVKAVLLKQLKSLTSSLEGDLGGFAGSYQDDPFDP